MSLIYSVVRTVDPGSTSRFPAGRSEVWAFEPYQNNISSVMTANQVKPVVSSRTPEQTKSEAESFAESLNRLRYGDETYRYSVVPRNSEAQSDI